MIFSAQHNCVIYDHAAPQQVVASIAGARLLDAAHVAVPATLFNLQLARVLGLSVPEIMDISGYDWPGRFPPYKHQRHTSNFMALHPRCFNLGDMGVGKTLATLWAADFLMQQGAVRKAVIVSPLSTLKRVWEDEIFRHFLGRRTAVVLHGDRARRERLLHEDHDFYIINHDGLGIGHRRAVAHKPLYLGPLAEEIRARPDIDLLIVDEASAYKEAGTMRYRIMRAVAAEKPYVWLLSGTPTPNAPTDAWALARLIGGMSHENFRSFRERTMYAATTFKWLPRAGAHDIVHKTLQPSIRYSRDECIDLPECVVETRDVPMSQAQQAAYDTMKKELALTLKSGTVSAFNEASLRTKLIQISCGALYGEHHTVHRVDAQPRIDAMHEVIESAGAKVLVFAPLTSVVDLLYSELRDRYGHEAVARVYGATSPTQRDQIFQDFEKSENPKYIVADAGTMSHGLTLIAASTVLWYGPVDRLETYDQANARMNRPGQKHKMYVIRFVSNPIEREIFKRLETKQSLQGAILQLAEEAR